MERSDPPRPVPVDPDAAKPEPQKPAVDGAAASESETEMAGSSFENQADDPFVEAEPEAVERTHFEDMERETTQPLRRYRYTPLSARDIAPADIAHAVDYEARVDSVAASHAEDAPPAPETSASNGTPESLLDPWPAAVEPANAPPFAAPQPTTDDGWSEPARSASPEVPAIADLPAASDTAASVDAATHAPEPAPQWEPSTPAEPPLSQSHAFEPHPLEVLPPRADPPRPAPPPYVPRHTEPPAPASITRPISSEPAKEAQPLHGSQPPVPTLRHDVAAVWAPSPSTRREPSFYPSASVSHADAVPTPDLAPARRDHRDLFRRAVRVTVITFCGWFIAVLLLIAAYRFINPPFSMLMALQFMSGTPIQKQWVPIERMSPNLTRAVIVAEDGRFCQHWGIDFIEAADAIRRASDGYPRGASTITMQVAKNLFLLPAKSYLRKLVEIPLTFAIELAWPKWRILEIYLNIVEWGPGVFGAEAASQAHFRRSAMGLTSRQAAQLAVTLPNPIIRDAGDPGPRTAQRASVIQARAARNPEAAACVDGLR